MRPKKLWNWLKDWLKIILPVILLLGLVFFWGRQIIKQKTNLKKAVIKESVAALAFEKDFFLTDEDGVVLGRTQKTDLPVIIGNNLPEITVGEQFEDETIKKAIGVLLAFQLNLWEPKVIYLSSERYLEIWFKDNLQVLFSLQKETQIQLDSLQLIFSRAKIEGRNIKKIDLRFDKPVVNYE